MNTIWGSLIGVLIMVSQVTCPYDDSGAYFTGRTKVSKSGTLLKEYKCYTYGDYFWVKW